jgi:ParB family chromosome partitioning protein
MNLTSVAHHLMLLELQPELDLALQSGRCTSPRTLHELSKLREEQPDAVNALVAGGTEITRTRVAALRNAVAATPSAMQARPSPTSLLTQADVACLRLERVLDRVHGAGLSESDREALRRRVASLTTRLA